MSVKLTNSKTYENKVIIYENLCSYWENIAINIFKWKNLDKISETLTSRIIEKQLYENGKSLFFKDKSLGIMSLNYAPRNQLNVYGEQTEFETISANGKAHGKYTTEDSVLIRNNPLMKSTKELVDMYCWQLADIEVTKKQQRNALKVPYIIETNNSKQLTAKNVFAKLDGGEPVIFENTSAGSDGLGLNIQNNGVTYQGDMLDDDYNNTVAKILTLLGLNNFVEDKAERVQSAEVDSQQEYIISSFKSMLDMRKEAVENINKMFGINLEIEYVEEEQVEEEESTEDNEEMEEEDNG